jgi:hypothetical protein
LVIFGAILVATNPWFTMVDDEIAIIDVAAKPVLHTVGTFLGGAGQHEHPPLSDLILHGWLRLTGGDARLLRLPSIFFYILGGWLLTLAARRIGGQRAGYCTLALFLLWPYGFHFGRIAGWYSFTFMLVSLLTLVYLRYVDQPSLKSWVPVALAALALVYSNYFGWALLGCLGIDLLWRFPRDSGKWLLALATGGLLLAAAIPILPAFLAELHKGGKSAFSISAIAVGVYNLYCLFVSESVAPWFWAAGIAAGLAIAGVLLLTAIFGTAAGRRLPLYFVALLVVMTALQIGNTKRVLMISPWLMLAIGTALAATRALITTTSAQSAPSRTITTAHGTAHGTSHGTAHMPQRILAAALIVISAIGWFGIFSRRYYAAPRWIEPWDAVANRAATEIEKGGIVIGNNGSFFFYLTQRLPESNPNSAAKASNAAGGDNFAGFLPTSVRAVNVYTPQQWVAAGRPVNQNTWLFDGLSFQAPGPSMDELRAWLGTRCQIANEEQLVHDAGAEWKRKYQPGTGQREWRIQEAQYNCATN